MRKCACLLLLLLLGMTGTGHALGLTDLLPPMMDRALLAKAEPDECFRGIGDSPPLGPACAGTPKTNEAYVWGLAQAGRNLWLGSAPNVHCLVIGSYLGMTEPFQTDSWVCEFGRSWTSTTFGLPAGIGDWRPAGIYSYNLDTGVLTDRTPADPRLGRTMGIRSAGSLGGVVFLAGPGFTGGINLFAYNAATGQYIGSTNLPQYGNIRKWLVHGGQLYTAVGLGREGSSTGGRVLRWTGSAADPFRFEEVGKLDGSGAELASYGDRIALTTWPGPGNAGLFISPPVPGGGLTGAHLEGWAKIWGAGNYEPDPVVAATYGGGALAYHDGWLYWGTMHVPFLAATAHFRVHGTPDNTAEALEEARATHRAVAVFRGRNLHDPARREIQLLYGESALPAFRQATGTFVSTPTGMRPLFGPSGFGNPFNNYTWTMQVAAGQLFVGTMDWSYLFDSMASGLLAGQASPLFGVLKDIRSLAPLGFLRGYGADLWRFPSSASPAIPESVDGVGNHLNYGIRTLIGDNIDPNVLYVGTANPMNLEPEGGWELIRLKKGSRSWFRR